MRAILLCAGQGKRLLPLTEREPKCLLPVDDHRSILEFQLAALARGGLRSVCVVAGFGANRVEERLRAARTPGIDVEVVYNPFFAVSDNLVSCWVARSAMSDDFLLLNGDTVFEAAVLDRVLDDPSPIAVAIDRKPRYDDDDMKVSLAADRLLAIGKTLPADRVDGESIGLLAFRGSGAPTFRDAVLRAVRRPEALRAWYLAAVDEIARDAVVNRVDIEGLWWREVDDRDDLCELQSCICDGRVSGKLLARP
ncbi:MAG: phosphocholine cytidylyltransferase family protein [Myxococcales bacterium]|nr:phosphocholine cytidylyltransferase family protein [Myxococcales bacterium]